LKYNEKERNINSNSGHRRRIGSKTHSGRESKKREPFGVKNYESVESSLSVAGSFILQKTTKSFLFFAAPENKQAHFFHRFDARRSHSFHIKVILSPPCFQK
jgi:hypothetical protein